MAKKTRGLGRGLEALLPDAEEALSSGVQEISLGDIDPNPDQPRRTFSEESIAQLAQSIREQGVLQPILVTPQNGGRYRIVAGERRWRASRAAGLDKVPVIVRDLDVIQQMEIALIENLQREDLNPIEVAQGIRSLMQQCGYTQETVANRLSKSRPAVANLLRLLTLPEEVIELVRQGSLSAGHARVLAGLDDNARKLALAKETIEQGYSVRQLEALAAAAKAEPEKQPAPKPKKAALPAELTELESRIRETMGVRATLTGTVKKGKIVLQYYSQDELEHLNDLLLRLEE
ncbi:MAG: ParB/RepB/Spo0J family partition protein [Clostridia bacterium]|nr:ParB/RepB/Spo0J family partition protein [Clostridia bacterium]MBQ7865383.1 ParB/RepB/Spo0J family partition protein [Clostridia bacterium]